MGLLYCESFSGYGDVTDVKNGLTYSTAVKTFNATGGPFGNPSIVLGGTTSATCKAVFRPTSSTTPEIAVSFWAKFDLVSTSSSSPILAFGYNSGLTNISTVGSPDLMVLNVSRGGGYLYCSTTNRPTTYLTGNTGTGSLQHDKWHHITYAMYPHNTSGTCRVWIDGALLFNFSGDTIYTGSSFQVNEFFVESGSTNAAWDWEIADIIVWDDQDYGRGDSDLTTFDGTPMRIESKFPTGAGTYSQWTSSSGGANYTDVDETNISSTDYVYASTDGAADSYTFEALSTNVSNILGVCVTAAARRDGASRQPVDGICVSSGSSAEANWAQVPSLSTGDVYFRCQSFIGQDPATSTAWTTSGFDAAEFGIKFESST